LVAGPVVKRAETVGALVTGSLDIGLFVDRGAAVNGRAFETGATVTWAFVLDGDLLDRLTAKGADPTGAPITGALDVGAFDGDGGLATVGAFENGGKVTEPVGADATGVPAIGALDIEILVEGDDLVSGAIVVGMSVPNGDFLTGTVVMGADGIGALKRGALDTGALAADGDLAAGDDFSGAFVVDGDLVTRVNVIGARETLTGAFVERGASAVDGDLTTGPLTTGADGSGTIEPGAVDGAISAGLSRVRGTDVGEPTRTGAHVPVGTLELGTLAGTFATGTVDPTGALREIGDLVVDFFEKGASVAGTLAGDLTGASLTGAGIFGATGLVGNAAFGAFNGGMLGDGGDATGALVEGVLVLCGDLETGVYNVGARFPNGSRVLGADGSGAPVGVSCETVIGTSAGEVIPEGGMTIGLLMPNGTFAGANGDLAIGVPAAGRLVSGDSPEVGVLLGAFVLCEGARSGLPVEAVGRWVEGAFVTPDVGDVGEISGIVGKLVVAGSLVGFEVGNSVVSAEIVGNSVVCVGTEVVPRVGALAVRGGPDNGPDVDGKFVKGKLVLPVDGTGDLSPSVVGKSVFSVGTAVGMRIGVLTVGGRGANVGKSVCSGIRNSGIAVLASSAPFNVGRLVMRGRRSDGAMAVGLTTARGASGPIVGILVVLCKPPKPALPFILSSRP
jgi:hypothetical protein